MQVDTASNLYKLSCLSLSAFVAAVGLFGCERKSQQVLYASQSTNGGYTLIVRGPTGEPKSLFVEHVINAEIRNPSQAVVAEFELYRNDSLDRSFSERYGPPTWVARNVVRFNRLSSLNSPSTAEFLFENDSEMTLDCVRISARDLFLLLDVKPHTTTIAVASVHPPAEEVFLSAEACTPKPETKGGSKDIDVPHPTQGFAGRYVVTFDGQEFHFALNPLHVADFRAPILR